MEIHPIKPHQIDDWSVSPSRGEEPSFERTEGQKNSPWAEKKDVESPSSQDEFVFNIWKSVKHRFDEQYIRLALQERSPKESPPSE